MSTTVEISDASLFLLKQKFMDWKWIALDSSNTASSTSQSAPIAEITGNGGARAAADVKQDPSTGQITISHQWVFQADTIVGAIVPMNSATVGTGTGLCRYIPESGSLPDKFKAGGSLLVTISCDIVRASA